MKGIPLQIPALLRKLLQIIIFFTILEGVDKTNQSRIFADEDFETVIHPSVAPRAT